MTEKTVEATVIQLCCSIWSAIYADIYDYKMQNIIKAHVYKIIMKTKNNIVIVCIYLHINFISLLIFNQNVK